VGRWLNTGRCIYTRIQDELDGWGSLRARFSMSRLYPLGVRT
jgi:hypothetical protein